MIDNNINNEQVSNNNQKDDNTSDTNQQNECSSNNNNENTNSNNTNSQSSYEFGKYLTISFELCLCLLILSLTLGGIIYLFNLFNIFQKPIKTINKLTDSVSNIASDTIDSIEKTITGERAATDTIDFPKEKPVEEYKTTLATVSTSMEKAEVVYKEEKKEVVERFFIDKNKQGSFERNFKRQVNNVINNRKKEVKEIFEEAKSRIPDFVENHYEERNSGPHFVDLMNKELLSDETLDDFLANTALEIDEIFYDSINEALDEALVSVDLGTDTLEEFKKRLPSAREICNQIYTDIMNRTDPRTNKPLYTKRKSELLEKYDNIITKYPTLSKIGKAGFVVILGYFFPPSLIITAPALFCDFAFNTFSGAIDAKNSFKSDMISQFDKHCRLYQKNLEAAAKDIAKCYVDLLIKAKIKGIGDPNKKAYVEFPTQIEK